jgi:tellurite resistance protein TerC
VATPLFTVLVLVEVTDLVFATDSIPAVLSVTRSTFVAFSSNAFAVCGLRALYFCLEGARARLSHLDEGVAVVLLFVGLKMLVSHFWDIPTGLSLAVIAAILAVAVVWSLADTAD